MKSFVALFEPKDWEVTGFYPYTSIVSDVILTENENRDFLNEIWGYFSARAINLGLSLDNKIVLRITRKTDRVPRVHKTSLFIGFYDNRISMGLGVWQEEPRVNIYFRKPSGKKRLVKIERISKPELKN